MVYFYFVNQSKTQKYCKIVAFPKKIWHFQPRQSVDGDKTDSIFGNNSVELSLVPTFVAFALGPNCDDRWSFYFWLSLELPATTKPRIFLFRLQGQFYLQGQIDEKSTRFRTNFWFFCLQGQIRKSKFVLVTRYTCIYF